MPKLSRLSLAITLSVVAAALLAFASGAGAAVSGTVTPSSGLYNGSTPHVHATGLPANSSIQVLECKASAVDSTKCAAVTTDDSGFSDPSGNFDLDYTVQTLPNSTFPAPPIQCNDTQNDCALFVGIDFNNFSLPKTLIPFSFTTNPGVPESRSVILLPISAIGVLGAALFIVRRKRRSTTPSAV